MPSGQSRSIDVPASPPAETEESLTTQRRYDRQAALFDLMEVPVEFLAFGRLRRRLWSDVEGAIVLEIGVGTGKNIPHHRVEARTVAVDISVRMLRRATHRARRLGHDVDFVLADAQHLPFRDSAFDAAASTFVFCSVPDPIIGLQEVRRVVRDGGHVHLLEHVRAGNAVVGRLMDLANPIAVRLSGANINRDTVSNVAKGGMALDSVESRGLGIIKLVRGSAGERPSGQGERQPPAQEVKNDVARR
jgi:ubiquinone/menaquinone biosynthesis C-methylase UbiE